jgi:squalene cyclase
MAPLIMLLLMQLSSPEDRAVQYVTSEVELWPAENRCFSCHNSGDGARAFIEAYRLKAAPKVDGLQATLDWLQRPEEWGKGAGNAFGDPKLARIQFAAALTDAVEAGLVKDRNLVKRAAQLLASHQEPDGSWQVDAEGSLPSAVGYGPVLATFMARRTLERANDAQFKDAVARADTWLRGAGIAATVNAAAVVLALSDRSDPASKASVERALTSLLEAQLSGGGWGAFPKSPAAPFESAMGLLALGAVRSTKDVEARIAKGRAFLQSTQFEDGGWPAALGAADSGTYARHMSTSAWATLALISTKPKQ